MADFKLSDTIACYPVNLTRLTTWFWTSRGSALLLPASSHSIVISGREEKREDAMERVHYAHHEKIIPRPRSTLNLSWNIKVILQRHQTCFRVLLFIVSIMLKTWLFLANIKTDGWRLLKFSQRKNIIVFFLCVASEDIGNLFIFKKIKKIKKITTQEVILNFF